MPFERARSFSIPADRCRNGPPDVGDDAVKKLEAYLERHFAVYPPDVRLRIASLFVAAVFFIATAIVLMDAGPRGDVINFYGHAMAIKDGSLPYTDFEFEFPPISLVFFTMPALFTSDLDVYCWLFAMMCAGFMSVAAYFIMRLAPGERVRYFAVMMFAVLVLLYMTESVKKFDSIVMSMTVIALYLFSKQRWYLAYGLIAVATFTKLYPCIFLPLMVAYNATSGRGGTDAVVKGVLSCLAVIAAVFIPMWAIGIPPSDSLSFIGFHEDRGFQVESVVATVIEALGLLGLTDMWIVDAHGTHDVAGPLADALVQYWSAVILLVVLIALAFCIRRMVASGDRFDIGRLSAAMLIVCIAFVLTNKVFSTQYMMWLFPFLAMLIYMPELECRYRRLMAMMAVMQIMCIVFLRSEIASGIYVLACIVRDLLMVAIAYEVVKAGQAGITAREIPA